MEKELVFSDCVLGVIDTEELIEGLRPNVFATFLSRTRRISLKDSSHNDVLKLGI